MSDHGHELRFGIFPSPDAAGLAHTIELAVLADTLGLDHVSLQDHPYQGSHADTWTLLSVIASRTSQVRVAPNVANLPLRPPVVLAKAAATLDLVTGGRVELGLGTGAFWEAIVAAGGLRRSPGESVEYLDEAIRLIRLVWQGGTVRFEGRHIQAVGLHAGPEPAHTIPIWVGAYKPRMLRLTGRLADAWVPSMGYADPVQLPAMNEQIDEAAQRAGRSPSDIRRIYNVFGQLGSAARSGSGARSNSSALSGSARDWSEQVAELAIGAGMSEFVLGTDDPDTVRVWATEVAPAVRELVEAERSAQAGPRAEPGPAASGRPSSVGDAVGSPGPGHAPSSVAAFAVRPTPDDGERLTGELDWDEPSRPSAPIPADARYSAHEQATAQHLVDVHDHLRQELAQVRDVVEQVRRGHLGVGQARSVINTMTMRQNNWTLGAYCESYCRLVTGHHTLEDRSVFPHLRRSQPDLAPVIDRLEREHVVIHEVLDQLDSALVSLVESDGYGSAGTQALAALAHRVDLLTDTLLSHLAYEERELLHPLARHGFA